MDTERHPCFGTFRRASRPATRRPLLKKGSIRKLFCGWATCFLWKGEESGMPEPLIFGHRSMGASRCLFSDTFRRAPALQPALCRAPRPAPRRPLLKKGSIRKLFLRMGDIFFMEGQRTRNAETVDFREPIYGYRASSLLWHFSQGFPPCNPATPFEKGVDPKTLSADGQHTFYGKAKNPECRNR